MSGDVQTKLRELIQDIKDDKLNSYQSINKLSALWSSFEEDSIMMNSEIDLIGLIELKKQIIISFIERRSELRGHNNYLNRILFLQEIGVHFDEHEIRQMIER